MIDKKLFTSNKLQINKLNSFFNLTSDFIDNKIKEVEKFSLSHNKGEIVDNLLALRHITTIKFGAAMNMTLPLPADVLSNNYKYVAFIFYILELAKTKASLIQCGADVVID